jgi:hypothetical protein
MIKLEVICDNSANGGITEISLSERSRRRLSDRLQTYFLIFSAHHFIREGTPLFPYKRHILPFIFIELVISVLTSNSAFAVTADLAIPSCICIYNSQHHKGAAHSLSISIHTPRISSLVHEKISSFYHRTHSYRSSSELRTKRFPLCALSRFHSSQTRNV